MRILLTGILACGLVIVVEISFAGPQQPPPSPCAQWRRRCSSRRLLDLKQIEEAGRTLPGQSMPVEQSGLNHPAVCTDSGLRQGDRRPAQGEPAGRPHLGTDLRTGPGAARSAVTFRNLDRALSRGRRQGVADFAQFRKRLLRPTLPEPARGFAIPGAAVLDALGPARGNRQRGAGISSSTRTS